MKRSQRARALVWAGAILFLAAAGLWVLSFAYEAAWTTAKADVRITRGMVSIEWTPPGASYSAPHPWQLRRVPLRFELQWLPSYERGWYIPAQPGGAVSFFSRAKNYRMIIPLWPLVAACFLLLLFGLYRGRKVPPGHCRGCGYNLTGNTSGVCPECGNKL